VEELSLAGHLDPSKEEEVLKEMGIYGEGTKTEKRGLKEVAGVCRLPRGLASRRGEG